MAFSNITRILLWIIAGISLLVVLFFYVSPKTVNYDDVEARVEAALNPVDMSAPVAMVPDSAATDSTAVEAVEEDAAFAQAEVLDTSGTDLKEVLSGYEYLVYYRTDIALIWAYILVVLTLIAAIVFPLIAVFTNPKALLRMAIVLAAAAVMVIISWVLSSDAALEIIGYTGTDNSDPQTLKMIDTVLFVTYMLFGLALGSILYAIISKAFK